ncbi:carbohydrate-binding domain-containing protein [Siccirubricoccus soli]|uniref:carbohydrate-binding domain-containing protein n=1 Tax=Siccirubricoccus soli TaxID=2899147 RepID=UPI0021132296|nr:carbohydrate-binding domain-containing protein [Siccirubricoccus soli]
MYIDSIAYNGTTVATDVAQHSGGAARFTVKGDWAAGNHPVAVNFLNDAYGGTATTDRNLHSDSIA